MINFIVSTVAFSLTAYLLNRYFKTHPDSSRHITLSIMAVATLVSIGAGWVADEVDGEAERHKNDPGLSEIVKSGDPIKIAKFLVGIN